MLFTVCITRVMAVRTCTSVYMYHYPPRLRVKQLFYGPSGESTFSLPLNTMTTRKLMMYTEDLFAVSPLCHSP